MLDYCTLEILRLDFSSFSNSVPFIKQLSFMGGFFVGFLKEDKMSALFIGFETLLLSMGYIHPRTQEPKRANRLIAVARFKDDEGEFLTVPFFATEKGVSEWLLDYSDVEDQDTIIDALEEAYIQDGDYPIAPLSGTKARAEAIIKRGHREGYRYFELDKLKSLPFSDDMSWLDEPIASAKKGKSKPEAFSRGKTLAKKEAPKEPVKEAKTEFTRSAPLPFPSPVKEAPPVKEAKEEPVKEEPPVVKGAIFDSLAKAQIVSLIKSKQPDFDWVSDKLPKDTLMGILQQFC